MEDRPHLALRLVSCTSHHRTPPCFSFHLIMTPPTSSLWVSVALLLRNYIGPARAVWSLEHSSPLEGCQDKKQSGERYIYL